MDLVKLYIAILDEFPDYMTPTLVAHAMLGAHFAFMDKMPWQKWWQESFKKCVVRVNQREFDKISKLPHVYLAHESATLDGRKACAVVLPHLNPDQTPNVLKFAQLWKPKA